MEKSRIMGIGIGRAGNVVLDKFLNKDKRYVGLFVNSAINDLNGLKMVDMNRNVYVFPATSGSGRDRKIAKDYLKNDVQGLADKVAKYPLQDTVIIFFSCDGGTGSGIAPTFAQVLRRTCPNKKINLIPIIPDFNKGDKLALENTLDCWNEIAQLSKNNIVDDIKFVDNSKRKNFEQINEKLVIDLDNSFTMNGECEEGSIDDNDSKVFNTAKGYGLILNLDGKYRSIRDAIDNALEDTVFAKPNDYVCDYMGISLKDYEVSKALEEFEYLTTSYKAKNPNHNTIVLGGCKEPSEIIETIKMAYDEIIERATTKNKNKNDRTIIDIEKTDIKKENVKIKTTFTSEEYNNLFDDLF